MYLAFASRTFLVQVPYERRNLRGQIDTPRATWVLAPVYEEATSAVGHRCAERVNRHSILSPAILIGPKVIPRQFPELRRVDPVGAFWDRAARR